MRRYIFIILFLTFKFWLAAEIEEEDSSFVGFRPYLEMSAGKEIGVDQSYSTLGVLTCFPISSCPRLQLYNDLCWHHFLKGSNGASVDFGIEYGDDELSYGGYIGYDWRRWRGNSFDQISAGVQMQYCCWEIAVDLNYPLQDKRRICFAHFDWDWGFHATFEEFEATYRILSINFSRLFSTCIPCIDFGIGVQPYYLISNGKNCICDRQKGGGCKARFLFDLYRAIEVEASISYDSIFRSRAKIVLEIDLFKLFCDNLCNENCDLFRIFSRQKVVALKKRESWERNW